MLYFRGYRRWTGLALLGMIVCVSGLAGCGGMKKKAVVSGKITYQGEALGNGTVVFIGKDGKGGSSLISAEGNYKISDAPVGPVKITVETVPTSSGTDFKLPTAGAEMPSITPKDGSSTAPGKYVKIPDKYKKPDQTPLTYEVKPGDQKKDITLE